MWEKEIDRNWSVNLFRRKEISKPQIILLSQPGLKNLCLISWHSYQNKKQTNKKNTQKKPFFPYPTWIFNPETHRPFICIPSCLLCKLFLDLEWMPFSIRLFLLNSHLFSKAQLRCSDAFFLFDSLPDLR